MAYATPDALRARYRTGITEDEFALRDDADLEQALSAASAEIDSWRPAGVVSGAGAVVLSAKCMTLARMLVHQDQALDEAHPIVRDGREVRSWLRALAAGTVRLPADTADAGAAQRVAVIPRELTYGADFLTKYTMP
jgi:phage gp36-like protein